MRTRVLMYEIGTRSMFIDVDRDTIQVSLTGSRTRFGSYRQSKTDCFLRYTSCVKLFLIGLYFTLLIIVGRNS